jgi:hypothetical protein
MNKKKDKVEPVIVKPAGKADGTMQRIDSHTIWEPIAIGLAFGLMISIVLYIMLHGSLK